jgi:hypothetical protein
MDIRPPLLLRLSALSATCLLLQACVMVPRTNYNYDPECRTVARQMTLEPVQVAGFGGCSNSGCAYLLVLAGATAAASTVVSGSIVIVGNIVYWLENQGRCQRAAAPAT